MGVEEHVFAVREVHQAPWGHPENLHDAGKLLHLVLPREERVARVELGEDAPKAPHVNRHCVRNPQHDLWRSLYTKAGIYRRRYLSERMG